MLNPEYFKEVEDQMPIQRIVHSETVYLADPEARILEGVLLSTPNDELIHARLFLDAATQVPGNNPFAKDPRFLDIPIQSMHEEDMKPAEKLRQEIDAIVRVEYKDSVTGDVPLQLVDLFEADSYSPNEGMPMSKKLTFTALGAFTISAVAASGIGFAHYLRRNK